MEQIIANELDYKSYNLTHSQLEYTKVLPAQGGNQFVISAAGTEVLLELPVRAMNLSKSILYFQLAILDAAGGAVNGLQPWIFADCLSMFRQIQLYTRSNTYVCDLYEVQNYTSVVWKPETKQADFLTNDQALNALTASSAIIPTGTTGQGNGFARFLQPSYINLPGCGNLRVVGSSASPSVASTSQPQLTGFEPLHFYTTNSVGNNAGNGTLLLNCEIPLGTIYNTIFALNKDLFFNEVMVMRLVFNGTSRICFTTTGANPMDPVTGAAAYTGTLTCQNLTLYLATEMNINIENSLRQKVQSGALEVAIPYVYTNKLSINAGTSQAVSVRYNRGHGQRLKKIYYAPFNLTESGNLSYDHNNIGALKISNLYTTIDNVRLQQYNVDFQNISGQSQSYLELQRRIKGSILATENLYNYNFFWLDDFTREKYPNEKYNDSVDENNMVQGMDLTTEKKYDIFLQTANVGFNHYVFAVTQKLIRIHPLGIEIV